MYINPKIPPIVNCFNVCSLNMITSYITLIIKKQLISIELIVLIYDSLAYKIRQNTMLLPWKKGIPYVFDFTDLPFL